MTTQMTAARVEIAEVEVLDEGFSEDEREQIMDLVQRLRHWYGKVRRWRTFGVVISQVSIAVPIVGADPFRLELRLALPDGVLAFYGPDRGITDGSSQNASAMGWQLPRGGAFVDDPRMSTQAVWLLLDKSMSSNLPVTITVSEGLGDVRYPWPQPEADVPG